MPSATAGAVAPVAADTGSERDVTSPTWEEPSPPFKPLKHLSVDGRNGASMPLCPPPKLTDAPMLGPQARRDKRARGFATTDAEGEPIAPAAGQALLCCNIWEHQGGAFGCRLLAGHSGPHALQDLPSRRPARGVSLVTTPRKRAMAAAANAAANAAAAAEDASIWAAPDPLHGEYSHKPAGKLAGPRSASTSPELCEEVSLDPHDGSTPPLLSASPTSLDGSAATDDLPTTPIVMGSRPSGSPSRPDASAAKAGAASAGVEAWADRVADSEIPGAAGAAAAPPPARKLKLFVWAQCDLCAKWRRLPPGHAPSEEAWWQCSMNPKRGLNRCTAPEEELEENELTGDQMKAKMEQIRKQQKQQQQQHKQQQHQPNQTARKRRAESEAAGADANAHAESAAAPDALGRPPPVDAGPAAVAPQLSPLQTGLAGARRVGQPLVSARPKRERKAPRFHDDGDSYDRPQMLSTGGRGGGRASDRGVDFGVGVGVVPPPSTFDLDDEMEVEEDEDEDEDESELLCADIPLLGGSSAGGMSIERMILAEKAMRQLERAFAAECDETLDSDPSASGFLAEVTKPTSEDEGEGCDLAQMLAGEPVELCSGVGAIPFLALCDGDFLRETLGQATAEPPSAKTETATDDHCVTWSVVPVQNTG